MTPALLVYNFLDEQGLNYTVYHHQLVYTVAEVDFVTPGSQVKNLLLHDHQDHYFLLIMLDGERADLKSIKR